MGSRSLFYSSKKHQRQAFLCLRMADLRIPVPLDSILSSSEGGGSPYFWQQKKNFFLLFSHLHFPGIITLAASPGKQKCTNTNYSSFPQWVALNRTFANDIKTTTKLSNNKLGKLRKKINPAEASKTGSSGTTEERRLSSAGQDVTWTQTQIFWI